MKIKEKPLITVMIPVYNTEQYLRRCFDSVIGQTYTNLEIIIINDGSTDNSLKICKEYSKKDNRIKLISKSNEGLSVARNVSIEYATGDFYGFVDSDDWVTPRFFETLLNLSLENEADMSRCQYFNDINEQDIRSFPQTKVLEKHEFMPLVLNDCITSHMWKNLFRKELFYNIYFPPGYTAQDMMVFHRIANKANKIAITEEKLYYYYLEREDNTSNDSSNRFRGTICRAMAFHDRYFISKNFYQEIEQNILKKTVRSAIASFCRSERSPKDNFNEELIILERFFKTEEETIFSSNIISTAEKIAVKLILYNSHLFMKGFKYIKI